MHLKKHDILLVEATFVDISHFISLLQSVWDRLVKLASGAEHTEVKFALPGQLPNEAELRKEEERKRKEKEDKKKKEAEEKKKKEEAAKKKNK